MKMTVKGGAAVDPDSGTFSRVFLLRTYVNLLPSHTTRRLSLISVSVALSQTPAYAARPRIWGERGEAKVVCPFMSQFLLLLIVPTHEGWTV